MDLDRLERWSCANLMKFSKAKCKILHLSWTNPKHKHRLDEELGKLLRFFPGSRYISCDNTVSALKSYKRNTLEKETCDWETEEEKNGGSRSTYENGNSTFRRELEFSVHLSISCPSEMLVLIPDSLLVLS